MILDGKVFSADRCSEKTTSVKDRTIDRWYSVKAHEQGGNIQALSASDGFLRPGGNQVLHADNCTYNALLRVLRALGERGFAILTERWHTLHRITAGPRKIGTIVQAALVLTHIEHGKAQ